MVIWISSDPHFFHENIIRFCKRPFDNVNDMNQCIVDKHNNLVKPEDHWYCLGDVTMLRHLGDWGKVDKLIKSMNGHKRLILGNHDHYHVSAYVEMGFEKVMAHQMLNNIRFTHFPLHPFSIGRADANVHGHIHDKASYPPAVWKDHVSPYINVSLDVTNFEPVSLEEIKDMIVNERERWKQTANVSNISLSEMTSQKG